MDVATSGLYWGLWVFGNFKNDRNYFGNGDAFLFAVVLAAMLMIKKLPQHKIYFMGSLVDSVFWNTFSWRSWLYGKLKAFQDLSYWFTLRFLLFVSILYKRSCLVGIAMLRQVKWRVTEIRIDFCFFNWVVVIWWNACLGLFIVVVGYHPVAI